MPLNALRPLFVTAVLLLAACDPAAIPPNAGPPKEGPLPPGGETACGAAGLQDLRGQHASVLATLRLAQPVRTIRPGDAVTMDFSAMRLNIEIDAKERISRLYCG